MIFQERLDRVLPYLRGFAFDESTLYNRFTILFPAAWDVSYLKSKSILLGVMAQNGVSNMFMVGMSTDKDLNTGQPIMDDKPFDYFLDEIERVIEINQEKERKAILLQQKIVELQRAFSEGTLREVQNLKIVKDDYRTSITPDETIYNKMFTPKIELPVQDPSFLEEPIQNIIHSDFIEDDFDPFAREDDDKGMDESIPFEPDENADINLPGIVKEMVRYKNLPEDLLNF